MEILKGMKNDEPVIPQLRHDLESFGWVLGYAFSRYHAAKNRLPGVLSEEDWNHEVFLQFCRNFGQSNIHDIFMYRSGSINPLTTRYPANLLSYPLARLFVHLDAAINESNYHIRYPVFDARPAISYETFFGLLDTAISSLQA